MTFTKGKSKMSIDPHIPNRYDKDDRDDKDEEVEVYLELLIAEVEVYLELLIAPVHRLERDTHNRSNIDTNTGTDTNSDKNTYSDRHRRRHTFFQTALMFHIYSNAF